MLKTKSLRVLVPLACNVYTLVDIFILYQLLPRKCQLLCLLFNTVTLLFSPITRHTGLLSTLQINFTHSSFSSIERLVHQRSCHSLIPTHPNSNDIHCSWKYGT